MRESTKVSKKNESEKARSFTGVRRNFSRGGQGQHFVYHFQIADDQYYL